MKEFREVRELKRPTEGSFPPPPTPPRTQDPIQRFSLPEKSAPPEQSKDELREYARGLLAEARVALEGADTADLRAFCARVLDQADELVGYDLLGAMAIARAIAPPEQLR